MALRAMATLVEVFGLNVESPVVVKLLRLAASVANPGQGRATPTLRTRSVVNVP